MSEQDKESKTNKSTPCGELQLKHIILVNMKHSPKKRRNEKEQVVCFFDILLPTLFVGNFIGKSLKGTQNLASYTSRWESALEECRNTFSMIFFDQKFRKYVS